MDDKTRYANSERKVDGASLALLVCGLMCAVGACWLIISRGVTPLIVGPSIMAIVIGAKNLWKWEVKWGEIPPPPHT